MSLIFANFIIQKNLATHHPHWLDLLTFFLPILATKQEQDLPRRLVEKHLADRHLVDAV
jgi:hypothetical protein